MDHRPSVIAAAAVLVALDQRLTRTELESKMNAISSCGFLQAVSFTKCVCLCRQSKLSEKKKSNGGLL